MKRYCCINGPHKDRVIALPDGFPGPVRFPVERDILRVADQTPDLSPHWEVDEYEIEIVTHELPKGAMRWLFYKGRF